MNDILGAILVGALLWLFTAIAYCMGLGDGKESLQDNLVKEGKAEYYLDENNERQWRMK